VLARRFEAAAALGEEARNTRRSVPASTIWIVVVTGIFYLLVVCAETFAAGRHGIAAFIQQSNPLGYLTSRYWSPSALWTIDLVVVLTGLGFVAAAVNAAIRILFAMGREQVLPAPLARLSRRQTPAVAIGCLALLTLMLGLSLTYLYGGARTFGYLGGAGGLSVVLVYLTVNIAVIRAFRTEFREEFRLWRHLVIPAAATLLLLFPLWGILRPPAYVLMAVLPFMALGWLCIGAIAAGFLRTRRTAAFGKLGRVFMPGEPASRSPRLALAVRRANRAGHQPAASAFGFWADLHVCLAARGDELFKSADAVRRAERSPGGFQGGTP
jgi:amino acid transporter